MVSLAVALVACLPMFSPFAVAQVEKKKVNEWWNASYFTKPLNSPHANDLPLISVSGNRFVDPQGRTMVFRGVNIADLDKIESEGHWSRDFMVKVKATGATLVRIPVHPVAWRARGAKGYLELLDQAVEWATELGMYVDIDWHSIGNLKSGMFQDPMYETSIPETLNFWRIISAHYAGNHTVAFSELFNEPTIYNSQLGAVTWDEWRQLNEEMITVIRAQNSKSIPLVAGFDWAYDLTPLRQSPIRAEGIGYVTHPYPNKRTRPWEDKWDEDFGFAAGKYPIMATEIGADAGEVGTYGPAITSYLESRGISWTVWCFDPEWGPTMVKSWNLDYTEAGKYFSDFMLQKARESSSPASK